MRSEGSAGVRVGPSVVRNAAGMPFGYPRQRMHAAKAKTFNTNP